MPLKQYHETTYLFGAGVSVEAGVPGAVAMLKQVYDEEEHPLQRRALNIVIGGLQQHKAIRRGKPFSGIDVEEVYATLLRLGDREDDVLAPFVAAWTHASQQEITSAAERSAFALATDLAGWTPGSRPTLERFAAAHASRTGRSDSDFRMSAHLLKQAVLAKCQVREPAQLEYLASWIFARKNSSLWIATLNYDNCVEVAAECAEAPLHDGIGENGTFFLSAKGRPGVNLAKLHGSFDWSLDGIGRVRKGSAANERGVIFGGGDKLRARGPYLDLLSSFRARLTLTSDLHICGYSFRDPHINDTLAYWWDTRPATVVTIHDPDPNGELIQRARSVFSGESRQFFHDVRTAKQWMESGPV